jgi:vacuolar-type H+-ATPase subunit I/STV1
MTQHIVVGVYDAEADAAAAVRDLEAADVPADAISQHTKANFGGTDFSTANAITHKQGFWGRLFNTIGDDDSGMYNRSMERGSTVVTVAVSDEDVDRVSAILESHSPIDVEDESSGDLPSEPSDAEIAEIDDNDTPRVRCYVIETLEVETEPRGTPKN